MHRELQKSNFVKVCIMDLVSHLKRYLDSKQIEASRNLPTNALFPAPQAVSYLQDAIKKVSDEIISKIHLAYPDLNIVWLDVWRGKYGEQCKY